MIVRCRLCLTNRAFHLVSGYGYNPMVCTDCLDDIATDVHRCCGGTPDTPGMPVLPADSVREAGGLDLAAHIVREVSAA